MAENHPSLDYSSSLECRMCSIKKENPHYSNYDIREIIMKDCIEIWQKATIREALPEEFKDKKLAEFGRAGNEAKYGSGQATKFDTDENRDGNGDGGRDSNLAESGSVGPIENVSVSEYINPK